MQKLILSCLLLNTLFGLGLSYAETYSSNYYLPEAQLRQYFSEIRPQDKAHSGYVKIAANMYLGSMADAHDALREALPKEDFRKLAWGPKFHGTVIEFQVAQSRDFTKFKGVDGYINFADKYYRGNMIRAHQNAAALLFFQGNKFHKLKWGKKFKGNTTQFLMIQDILRSDKKQVDSQKWFGRKNGMFAAILEYTIRTNEGSVHNRAEYKKIMNLFLSALTKAEIKSLGWDNTRRPNLSKRSANKTMVAKSIAKSVKEAKLVDPARSARKGIRK